VSAPLDKLPLFVKAGSFIPSTENLTSTVYYTTDKVLMGYYPDVSVPQSDYTLYTDDGKTFGAYASGSYETIRFEGKTYSDHLAVTLHKEGAGYAGSTDEKQLWFTMHRITQKPVQVLIDNEEIPLVFSSTDYDNAVSASYYQATTHLLKVHFPWDLSDGQLVVKFTGAGIGDIATNSAMLHLGNPVPNPFSKQTRLEVAIPETGTYQLTVYDVWGRKVFGKSYYFGQTGSGTVQWNGKSSAGNCLSEGTYVIVVSSTHGKKAYRKVVLGKE